MGSCPSERIHRCSVSGASPQRDTREGLASSLLAWLQHWVKEAGFTRRLLGLHQEAARANMGCDCKNPWHESGREVKP